MTNEFVNAVKTSVVSCCEALPYNLVVSGIHTICLGNPMGALFVGYCTFKERAAGHSPITDLAEEIVFRVGSAVRS